jgi:hypothetical protein
LINFSIGPESHPGGLIQIEGADERLEIALYYSLLKRIAGNALAVSVEEHRMDFEYLSRGDLGTNGRRPRRNISKVDFFLFAAVDVFV